ncbi:MAG: PEP-CTERM sorting domain-containing protein [Thermodesulfobacteriota bacterium]
MHGILRLILMVLIIQTFATINAQGTDYLWTKSTNGDWNDTSAWTPTGAFPNSGNDTARVDDSTPGVTVSVNDNFTVGQITLVADTGVTINNGQSLHLYNSSGLAPIYAGTLTLNGTSAPTSLFADGADVGFARRIHVALGGDGQNYLQGTGKFILEAYSAMEGHGYIQSNFDNRGTITAKGGVLEVGAISLINSSTMTNDSFGSFSLNGTQVSNNGTMSGSFSMNGTQVNNNGTMSGSFSMKDTQVSGTGQMIGLLKMENVTLIDQKLTGSLEVKGDSEFKGAITKATQNYYVTVNSGQKLSLSPSANAPVFNGDIALVGSTAPTTLYADGAVATLKGNTVLGGIGNNFLQGTGFINDHGTISGSGYIQTNLINSGKIMAQGGVLEFGNVVVESSGTISGSDYLFKGTQVSGTGSLFLSNVSLENATLIGQKIIGGNIGVKSDSEFKGVTSLFDQALPFNARINSRVTVDNGQKLSLSASEKAPVINYGSITLNGTLAPTTLYANGVTATLNSNVILGGTGNNFLQGTGFINSGWISGQGYIQAPITNTSTGVISGALQIQESIANNGFIIAKDGVLDIQSAITGSGNIFIKDNATLKAGQSIQAANLSMDQMANLVLPDNATVDISQGFILNQKDTSFFSWGSNTTLKLTGTKTGLEVGGNDFGNHTDGFANNFNITNLVIDGMKSYAFLADSIDNGHRGGLVGAVEEALYVDSLFIGEDDTLNLNNLHLYLKDFGLVTATNDWLNGHGKIINVAGDNLILPPNPPGPPNYLVPLPSTLLLLGSGLLGLAGLRRKSGRG